MKRQADVCRFYVNEMLNLSNVAQFACELVHTKCFIFFPRFIFLVLLAVPSAAIHCRAGFSLVPYNIVSQIVAGNFTDLAELLSVNLKESESEPRLLFDGIINLTSFIKHPNRKMEDITIIAWSLIFETYFPSRWRDFGNLTLYRLLI